MADSRTLEDRAQAALIRDWAAENGITVGERGRIPAGVRAAYEAATGNTAEPETGDGPDWDAALSAAKGADPLALLEDQLGEEAAGRTGHGSPSEDPGPPPPADLDEARARLGGKAKTPGWARDGKASKQAPPVRVTRAVVGDIEGKLTLLLSGPAVFWQMADPLCGGTFADNLDNIVRKAVPLIVQSPDAVKWFTKGTTFLLWLDLVWALQPVAQAVYAHHVAASVMVLPDGRVVPAVRLDDGRIVPADRAPQQAAPDLSAYTTEVNGHVPPVPA